MAILESPESNAVPASTPIRTLFTPALSATMLSPALVPIRVFVVPLAVFVMRSIPVSSCKFAVVKRATSLPFVENPSAFAPALNIPVSASL